MRPPRRGSTASTSSQGDDAKTADQCYAAEVPDIEMEVNLRIPNPKTRALNEQGYPIDYASVRFIKRIVVPAIPKTGTTIPLSTASGTTLQAEVLGTQWSEEKSVLVLICKYADRSIPQDKAAALAADSEWFMKPLLY
jgi:hypothetical protein